TAASPAAGTPFGVQLAAVNQSPDVTFQVKVPALVRGRLRQYPTHKARAMKSPPFNLLDAAESIGWCIRTFIVRSFPVTGACLFVIPTCRLRTPPMLRPNGWLGFSPNALMDYSAYIWELLLKSNTGFGRYDD